LGLLESANPLYFWELTMTNNTRRISAIISRFVTVATGFAVVFQISALPLPAQQPRRDNQQLGLRVQLPVLRSFSIQTAVRVPDGGTMPLGGVSRSASGRISNGTPGLAGSLSRPWRNSASGRSASAAGVTVRTRIISQREIESRLMGEDAVDPYRLGQSELLKPRDASDAAIPSTGKGAKLLVKVPAEIEQLADFLTANVARR
jgi:hypothetical protein